MIERFEIKDYFPNVEFERESVDYCIGTKLPKSITPEELNDFIKATNEDCYGHFIKDGILFRTTKSNQEPERGIIQMYNEQNMEVLNKFMSK